MSIVAFLGYGKNRPEADVMEAGRLDEVLSFCGRALTDEGETFVIDGLQVSL